MKTVSYKTASDAQKRKNATNKSQFQRSVWNNGDQCTIIRSDFAVLEENKDDEDARLYPVFVVKKGTKEVNLFVSSLVRGDEDVEGNIVPKVGTFNSAVSNIWENDAFTTDDACFGALQSYIGKTIKASRLNPKKPDGSFYTVDRFGREVRMVQLNWGVL